MILIPIKLDVIINRIDQIILLNSYPFDKFFILLERGCSFLVDWFSVKKFLAHRSLLDNYPPTNQLTI